jgi:hypothetical protein
VENRVEKILSGSTGNKALYEMISDNGFRIVNFAMSGHLIVRNTFLYSEIHLR